MKPLLKRNLNSEIDFLLQGSLYESLYAKIQEVLNAEEASVFCQIERKRNECLWYGEESWNYRPLSGLSEEEKFNLSDILAEKKAEVLPKLKTNKVLFPHAEALFSIPSEEDIYQVQKPDGTVGVALSRWAIKLTLSSENADPIIKLINIPKPDHYPVSVAIRYSDGAPFASEPFFFYYQDNSAKRLKTNEKGHFQLGQLKEGRPFVIRQLKEDSEEQRFIVDKEQSVYPVIFPRYIDFSVLVINQEGTPMVNQEIHLIKSGEERVYRTGEDGEFLVESVLLDNERIELTTFGGDFSQTYPLNIETEQLVFRLEEKMFGELTLLVKDQHDKPYGNYLVKVEEDEDTSDYRTNKEGRVELGAVEYKKELSFVDGKDPDNKIDYTVQKGAQEVVLRVDRPVIPPVKVRLLNHKKEPIPAVPLDLRIGESVYQRKTNEEGVSFWDKKIFTDQEKVKLGIRLKTKRGKEKVVKKTFKYDAGVSEYTIQLRKFNWWWLLLLLLPLLLIRCEKDVFVKVQEGGTNAPVSEALVHFGYNKAFVYDQGRFFTNDADPQLDTTDVNGLVKFSNLEYSVYSWIFKFNAPAITYASSHCFASDTLSKRYHFIWDRDTLNLKVLPVMAPMDFQVVDTEDGEPIPDAKVEIEASYLDRVYQDSAITDPNGRVVFSNIPKCGLVDIAQGSAEGYYPDEIKEQDISELLMSLDPNRTLRLKPIKKKLVFFVEDCKTKRRIPGAEVTIELDFDGKKSTQKKRTNVNGKGKGEYNDAHTIADVTLIGAAPPYYKGAKLPTYKVGEFINLPDSLRTICLEPIANIEKFKNVDSLTNQPLKGVTNEIVIENNGQTKRTTAISDRNGEFVVEVNPGDKVSIVSKYPPDYEENASKIKNKDGIKLKEGPASGRTIPLKPKMSELVFRTVDADNPSIVVPNATLRTQISIRGKPIALPTPQVSDSNGEFVVKAPLVANISIEASKSGYGSNSTKIHNASFKALANSTQPARDIPLRKNPPTPEPCETHANAGGMGIDVKSYDMKDPDLVFSVSYDMKTKQDHMIIYCGKGTSGKVLANTPGPVSYTGSFQIDMSDCATTWITIKMIGRTDGTEWDYDIICPN